MQRGVQAIFSGKRSRQENGSKVLLYGLDSKVEPSNLTDVLSSRKGEDEMESGRGSRVRVSRILVVAALIGIVLTTMVGFSDLSLSPRQGHSDSGVSGSGPHPAVKTARTMSPSFSTVTNIAEAIVPFNQSYGGTVGVSAGDFVVVQIAYSEGTAGNLPDLYNVIGSGLVPFVRVAGASPGVEANFWEQAWTARASTTLNSAAITVSPDWLTCPSPCVSSIIITMTIGLYHGVAGVGSSITVEPSQSSAIQSAKITVTQPDSMLVELLSHGAYSNCGIDAALPGAGQTSRNCFTASTERTEFFDHTIGGIQSYAESFSWSQVEIQRGIYLELEGVSTIQ